MVWDKKCMGVKAHHAVMPRDHVDKIDLATWIQPLDVCDTIADNPSAKAKLRRPTSEGDIVGRTKFTTTVRTDHLAHNQ